MKVVRRYKSYDKRTLVIYDGKKPIAYVRPFYDWFSLESVRHIPSSFHLDLRRKYVMENLYWLIGRDCEEDEWIKRVNKWDTPDHVTQMSSMFFEGEKEIALNSFNN